MNESNIKKPAENDYIQPVSSDKVVRCEACGEMFLKTSFEGGLVRAFGMCQSCQKYFDGLLEFMNTYESEATDE